MKAKFIIDISDLEPLNLAYKAAKLKRISLFVWFLNGEQLTFDNIWEWMASWNETRHSCISFYAVESPLLTHFDER